ncbi:circularly permuted type 2 ATP-grasp protein [Pontiella sp.]|uniref:circularly permuted type 2 ATP-grasp protein n=1 Tax=Pontiella sp. TaxID=2837462 RepID=UPI00356726E0
MNSLINAYQPIAGAYSEMLDPQRAIRPPWQTMLDQLAAYGPEDIEARWQRAQRMIRENGVTYNVYDDAQIGSHPWMLDPVPLMIAPDEWEELSAGLIQRMKVLNLALADLYSDQTLLKNNVLPSELLFANPQFLRPCCPIKPPGGSYLTLHAVDLARTPAGKWCVVKDLAQSPPGAGYALENRLVVSRTFPSMYRDCGIQRLAPFFIALRDTLEGLSQAANPHIVVLTPGPHSSSYFEHAYIARYLGYPLVVGNDLTVRGSQVFLKTLSGLKKVDVILRRQADLHCDPLELASDSIQGIPGLIQAAIDGEVAIANALGSGLAETPALLPFFPGLCRALTGEEPLLGTLPTLWCGQEKECKQVLDQIDRWVVKRAFAGPHEKPVFVRTLAPAERAALAEQIKADPDQYIAQENIELSSSPCWQHQQMVPRHTMLRAFTLATANGWMVMPGGLVRTAAQVDSAIVSMESGGGSKDAWVLARGIVEPVTLLSGEDDEEIHLSRSDANLSSRVADNLFWLGRYVQRADMHARILRTILRRLTEEHLPDGSPELAELLRVIAVITGADKKTPSITDPLKQPAETKAFIFSMLYGKTHLGNLYNALTSACNIGATVRERISIDTWRILDRMNNELLSARDEGDLPDALDMLDHLLMPLSAFSGLSSESMTHGYGWRFMDMGFRMERATMSAQVLRELLAQPAAFETPVLDAILEVANSSMTYRSRYQSHVALLPLLDLLICDDTNPRSLAYQLVMVSQHINALSQLTERGLLPEQTLASELVSHIEQCDLAQLVQTDEQGKRAELSRFLAEINEHVLELSNMVTHRYLAHVLVTSRLSSSIGSENWDGVEDEE